MYIFVFLQFPLSPKYIFQFEQIYFAIWSNTFSNLNKYFCNLNKYSSLPFMDNGYISVFPQFPLSAKHFQKFPKQLSFAHCLSQSITIGKLTPTFNLTVFIYELYFNELSKRLIFSQSCHRVFGQGLYHRKLKCFWETNYFFLNPFPNRNTNPFCTYLWKSNERKIDIQFFCLNIFFGPKFSWLLGVFYCSLVRPFEGRKGRSQR